MRLLHQICGLAALLAVRAEETEDPTPNEESGDDGYQVQVMGFGKSDSENLNDFGVITNNYIGDFTDELMSNDHPSLVYVFDSLELSKDSQTKMIHESVMKPTFKEMKGLGRYYVYDCQHPTSQKHIQDEDDFFNTYLRPCHSSNEKRSPSFQLYQEPEQRKNPYTGENMKKTLHQW